MNEVVGGEKAGSHRTGLESIGVERIGPILQPDSTRVLIRPFRSGNRKKILEKAVGHVMALSDDEVDVELAALLHEFGHRHQDVEAFALNRFTQVNKPPGIKVNPSTARRALIGSYFCHEYSIEAAALFNPSIVKHPDQSSLSDGALRFVMSLRAVGEGHISSIEFRTGVVYPGGRIDITPAKKPLREPVCSLSSPGDKVIYTRKVRGSGRLVETDSEVTFDAGTELSQRVLFPFMTCQRNGIEDARFMEFRDEDEKKIFYATYTAFDGKHIRPKLLSTEDFRTFRFMSLVGSGVKNKGMSLFPRKIDGRYVMLSRQDDRNILMMSSDRLQFWENPQVVMKPRSTWEMLKIGTCSSPIETGSGWLVLSHGVGPMRKYGIGAFLLDLNDPSRVLGRLAEPLMVPENSEREGYVPNVLYSCGALVHEGELIIPYASSDSSTRFAVMKLDKLLEALIGPFSRNF